MERSVSVVRAVGRRWVLVVLCAVLCAAAAFAFFEVKTPMYEAQSSVLFRETNLDASILEGSTYFASPIDPFRAAATNLELASTPRVATLVATALGEGDPDAILGSMSFRQRGESDIVDIVATDPEPARAQQLANAWAEAFVRYRRDTDRGRVQEAIELVQREIAQLERGSETERTESRIAQLRANLERLRVVQALQTGNVELLEAASLPTTPSGISRLFTTIAGLLLGATVGVIGAFAAERLDRSARDADTVSRILDLPHLADIPRAGRRSSAAGIRQQGIVAEAFRTVTVRLQFFNVGVDRRVVAISSATPEDGKTFVARHLALAAADSGRRTLLIDADLRRGDALQSLGGSSAMGLSTVLSGQTAFEDALVDLHNDPLGRSLSVLSRGPTPPNPLQLLGSDQMARLIEEAREHFDYVVIDNAPLLAVSDAEAVFRHADGILLVVRAERTTVDDLRRLRTVVDGHRDRALGFLLNDVQRPGGRSSYYAYHPVVDAAQTELDRR